MRHKGIHYVTAIAVTERKYFRSFCGRQRRSHHASVDLEKLGEKAWRQP